MDVWRFGGLLEVWGVVGGLGRCLEVWVDVWRFGWMLGGLGGCLEVWGDVWRMRRDVGGLGRCMEDEEGDLLGLLVESDVIVRNSDPLLHVGEQLFPPL